MEEFSVQTPRTGTEEPMPILSRKGQVGVRLLSKPSPLKTTAASVLAFGRDVAAGGGEGRKLSHYASAARAVFGTHSLRAAGFPWIADCVRKYTYDAAPRGGLTRKTSCGPWGWAWLRLALPAPKHSLLGYLKFRLGEKTLEQKASTGEK